MTDYVITFGDATTTLTSGKTKIKVFSVKRRSGQHLAIRPCTRVQGKNETTTRDLTTNENGSTTFTVDATLLKSLGVTLETRTYILRDLWNGQYMLDTSGDNPEGLTVSACSILDTTTTETVTVEGETTTV